MRFNNNKIFDSLIKSPWNVNRQSPKGNSKIRNKKKKKTTQTKYNAKTFHASIEIYARLFIRIHK